MQTGILDAVPAHARHLFFNLQPNVGASAVRAALAAFGAIANGRDVVAGVGAHTVALLGARIVGLRPFAALCTNGQEAITIPCTQTALWCWLRSDAQADAGDLLHRGRYIERLLAPAFTLDQALDVFRHGSGRDLTGYEDGTENPQGDAARAVAFVQDGEVGVKVRVKAGSFAAFQQWQHDFTAFDAMPAAAQDDAIGRRKSDNEELEDAPASAHVKRTAQESFEPEAFVLRRSMPWVEGARAGLAFLAFGNSFDAFEAQLRRMAGLEDGIVDALFQFSRPVSGAYFWCPPVRDETLDLRVLGIGKRV